MVKRKSTNRESKAVTIAKSRNRDSEAIAIARSAENDEEVVASREAGEETEAERSETDLEEKMEVIDEAEKAEMSKTVVESSATDDNGAGSEPLSARKEVEQTVETASVLTVKEVVSEVRVEEELVLKDQTGVADKVDCAGDGEVVVEMEVRGVTIMESAEVNSAGQETAAAQPNNTIVLGDEVDVIENGNGGGDVDGEANKEGKSNKDIVEGHNNENKERNENGENSLQFDYFEEDKEVEFYVGGLDKATVEDDLIEVFGKFGELKATSIVRNPVSNKSKGFAFIRYATLEQAKSALSVINEGIEVRGKQLYISASRAKDTLYVENICETWKKEDVLRTLRYYGIENVKEIELPEDPTDNGRTKGFAVLEFTSHEDAIAAFDRLRKPDAHFGCAKSAKVSITTSPSEEIQSQGKRVYVEGFNKAWDKKKLKDICAKYGEIAAVDLFQNLKKKRKAFGFVSFASQESAIACVEGINASNIGEGEFKVIASIARPKSMDGSRGGLKATKQSQVSPSSPKAENGKGVKSSVTKDNLKPKNVGGPSGRFKATSQSQVPPSTPVDEVDKEIQSPAMKDNVKSKKARRKRKASSEKGKSVPEVKTSKTPVGVECQNVGTTSISKRTNLKRKKPSKAEGRLDQPSKSSQSKRPSKKPKGTTQRNERTDSRNHKSDRQKRNWQDATKYRNPYASGYEAHPQHHGAAASIFASRGQAADMEPHAGYIKPASRNHERAYSVYNEPSVRTQPLRYGGHLEHAVVTTAPRVYVEPSLETRAHSYAGYLQPAVVQLPPDPYYEVRRAGRHDGIHSIGTSYLDGPSQPAAYLPTYASYAGQQVVGSRYQSNEAYPTSRTYLM